MGLGVGELLNRSNEAECFEISSGAAWISTGGIAPPHLLLQGDELHLCLKVGLCLSLWVKWIALVLRRSDSNCVRHVNVCSECGVVLGHLCFI